MSQFKRGKIAILGGQYILPAFQQQNGLSSRITQRFVNSSVYNRLHYYARRNTESITAYFSIFWTDLRMLSQLLYIFISYLINHNLWTTFFSFSSSLQKTLVYVLVKKPEAPEEIVPPTTPEAKVNKPEVFFIKYQNEKEQNGYESEIPASSIVSAAPLDATITNAADLSNVRSAEAPSQLAEQSNEQFSSSPLSSSSLSSSNIPSSSLSSSASPDREYIPAA